MEAGCSGDVISALVEYGWVEVGGEVRASEE